MKISSFEGIQDGSDESLLMLSYTDDGGKTFKTRKIQLQDFIDDFDVENLANVDGFPTQNQVLQFSDGTWSPVDLKDLVGGGGGGGPQELAINDLTDVEADNVQQNQILQYDGQKWVPTDFENAGLSNITYKFKNNRSPNPGDGFFTHNGWTANQSNLVTVDPITESGRDIALFLENFVTMNQTLTITQSNNPNNTAVFRVTLDPLPNARSISIPVQFIAGSGSFDNREVCTFKFSIPTAQVVGTLETPILKLLEENAALTARVNALENPAP